MAENQENAAVKIGEIVSRKRKALTQLNPQSCCAKRTRGEARRAKFGNNHNLLSAANSKIGVPSSNVTASTATKLELEESNKENEPETGIAHALSIISLVVSNSETFSSEECKLDSLNQVQQFQTPEPKQKIQKLKHSLLALQIPVPPVVDQLGLETTLEKCEFILDKNLQLQMWQIETLFQGRDADVDPEIMNLEKFYCQKLSGCDVLASTIELYKMDLLKYELEKENSYQLLLVLPKEFEENRKKLVENIITIVDRNEFEEETLHLGIYVADAFMVKVDDDTLRNIDWKLFGLVAICIASKCLYGVTPAEFCKTCSQDEVRSEYRDLESIILKTLNFKVSPPTVSIFRELVISQMYFPSRMTQWLTSDTVVKILKECLTTYKLISTPASLKAKVAIQICTKYFMENFESFQHLLWDETNNRPMNFDDDYIKALKSVALAYCTAEFLEYFFPDRYKKLIYSAKKMQEEFRSSPMHCLNTPGNYHLC